MNRRSELKRTPMRRTPKKTVAGRRRDTGPTPTVRAVVHRRAGWCCEVCGKQLHDGNAWTESHAIHHRRPRGTGGTSDPASNQVPNLLLVCGTGNESTSTCHGLIESQRSMSIGNGWLVRQGDDPAAIAVLVAGGARVILTADGGYSLDGAA